MNKKKLIIALCFIALIVISITVVFLKNQEKKIDFDELAERIEKSAEEVFGEDIKKVAKTELAATLTYGNGDEECNIYYRILKTTYYEAGDPSAVIGLHTEALNVLFPVELMDSCEEMMIQDWYGALYKKDDKAYLCWTYDPEVSYVLEYNPNKLPDSEIIKMAESAEPIDKE